MVAEESGMNFPAEREPDPASKLVSPAPAQQVALAFGADGSAATVLEPADVHDGRRVKQRGGRQSRRDIARTAEYLAESGRTPLEALHLITRRTLAEAVSHIRKAVPGVSHEWAANYYFKCLELAAPYMHRKQADIDLPPDLGASLTGIAGHFLAASAVSARLAGAGAGPARPFLTVGMDKNPVPYQADIQGSLDTGGAHAASDAAISKLDRRGRCFRLEPATSARRFEAPATPPKRPASRSAHWSTDTISDRGAE